MAEKITLEGLKALMVREGIKTMYVPVGDIDLSSYNLPSAGPRPNLTGMRNLYWGKKALIARQGVYAYKLS